MATAFETKREERAKFWTTLRTLTFDPNKLIDHLTDTLSASNIHNELIYHLLPFGGESDFTLSEVPLDVLQVLLSHERDSWHRYRSRLASDVNIKTLLMFQTATARYWTCMRTDDDEPRPPIVGLLHASPTQEFKQLQAAGVDLYRSTHETTSIPLQILETPPWLVAAARCLKFSLDIDFENALCRNDGHHTICTLELWLRKYPDVFLTRCDRDEAKDFLWTIGQEILRAHSPDSLRVGDNITTASYCSYALATYLQECPWRFDLSLYRKLLAYGFKPCAVGQGRFAIHSSVSALIITDYCSGFKGQAAHNYLLLLQEILNTTHPTEWRAVMTSWWRPILCKTCQARARALSLAELMAGAHFLDREPSPLRETLMRRVLSATSLEELNRRWPPECITHVYYWLDSKTVIVDNENVEEAKTDLKCTGLLSGVVQAYKYYESPHTTHTLKLILEYGVVVNWEEYKLAKQYPECAVLFDDWRHGRMHVRRSWPDMMKWLWVGHLKEKDGQFYRLPRDLMRLVVDFVHRSGSLHAVEWEKINL